MTLPKHQLAGPLEKKTGKEVWNMLEESKPQVCQKLADVFNNGKNAATIILKNKKICEQYASLTRRIKHVISQKSTKLSMTFYMTGIKNAMPQIFTQLVFYSKRKLWR